MKALITGIFTRSSSCRTSVITCLFAFIALDTQAQNVGINTTNPTRELSVNGSIIVDHDSTNYGTLYDPSLLFGANGLTGINSNNNPLNADYRALSFWTSGLRRMVINQYGQVGINTLTPAYPLDVTGSLRATGSIIANASITATNNITASNFLYGVSGLRIGGGSFNVAYKLQVNNGHSLFNGNGMFTGVLTSEGNLVTESNLFASGFGQIGSYLTVTGPVYANGNLRVYDNMAIGGNVDNAYRLRVYDGNARIGGEFHATGNSAIGGSVDNNFRFRVYDGNSRFGGDVEVTGTLNTEDLRSQTISQLMEQGLSGATVLLRSKSVFIS